MKYDELIAYIDDSTNGLKNKDIFDLLIANTKALREVVELHKPIEGHEHLCGGCWFGDGMMAYPCPTIQAIEKELG